MGCVAFNLSIKLSKNKKPRRTITFCLWTDNHLTEGGEAGPHNEPVALYDMSVNHPFPSHGDWMFFYIILYISDLSHRSAQQRSDPDAEWRPNYGLELNSRS